MAERVYVFSNGFEFDCWQERNCDRCAKNRSCDLFDAIMIGSAEDGLVSQDISERMGYSDDLRFVLGWPCKEFVLAAAAPGAGQEGTSDG
jgi:hypothetical protein